MRSNTATSDAAARSDAATGDVAKAPAEAALDPQESRRHYLEGSRWATEGQWQLALEAYRRALALYPSASTLYNLGYCEAQLGHLVEAWALMSQALQPGPAAGSSGLSAERRATVETERDRLRTRLPALATPSDRALELQISGGEVVPVAGEAHAFRHRPSSDATWLTLPPESRVYLDPGSYQISQRTDGALSSQHIEVSEGQTVLLDAAVGAASATPAQAGAPLPASQDLAAAESARVRPESPPPTVAAAPAAAHRPPLSRTLGIVSLIAGGLGLTTALVSTVVLVDADSELKASCGPDGACPGELAGTVGRYETAAVVTNVSLLAGLSATAVGVSLLVLGPAPGKPTASLTLTPTTLRLSGQF